MCYRSECLLKQLIVELSYPLGKVGTGDAAGGFDNLDDDVFESISREKIQAQFDINLFGVMDVTRAILPDFRRKLKALNPFPHLPRNDRHQIS